MTFEQPVQFTYLQYFFLYFSVKSFCHFWMFGGFPSSENTPFLHPFSVHLFFSLLLFLLEGRHLCLCPCFQQSSGSLRFSLLMRSGTGGSPLKPLSPPWQRSTTHPPSSQVLLLCTKATSDPFGSDTVNLRTAYGVSSGTLLPQLSIVSNVTASSETFCPKSCNYYVIVNDLTFPGFL